MISSSDSYPYDLDVYENKIFVIDNYTSSVLIFDNMGNFLTEFPVNKNFSNLDISGIDVHDDLIFISDSENNIIHILDLEGNESINDKEYLKKTHLMKTGALISASIVFAVSSETF